MAAFALNSLWLGPVLAGLVALFLPRRMLLGWLTLQGFAQALLWLYLCIEYRGLGPSYTLEWFRLGGQPVFYALGIHPANLLLVALTILIGHAALFYAFLYVARIRAFVALVYMTIGFAQGVFLAKDVLLFFVFYEASLVPAFLLIYGWGGLGRRAAAVKFALFTLGGSVLLLIGLLWAFVEGGQGGFWEGWRAEPLAWGPWWLMTLGLAVKLPLVPLHSWLGEAHVEADTAISMLLAGILLKLGGYGLLYWVWFQGYTLSLLVWGALSLGYAAAVATGQIDLKRMVAFTSIGHMALVAIGAGAGSPQGTEGAYYQLFTHGLISAGLFAWVGLIEKRYGSRSLRYLVGLLWANPRMQGATVLLFFGAIGVPGMALFISEMLIIWGTGEGAGWAWALAPAASLPLTGVYFLRAYRELAKPTEAIPGPQELLSLPAQEAVIWLLIGLSLLAGLYPKPFLALLAYVGA